LYSFPNEYDDRDFRFSGINFQNFQTKFWDQYTLNKADEETLSFWVNDIFAKKQAFFDICRLILGRLSQFFQSTAWPH